MCHLLCSKSKCVASHTKVRCPLENHPRALRHSFSPSITHSQFGAFCRQESRGWWCAFVCFCMRVLEYMVNISPKQQNTQKSKPICDALCVRISFKFWRRAAQRTTWNEPGTMRQLGDWALSHNIHMWTNTHDDGHAALSAIAVVSPL